MRIRKNLNIDTNADATNININPLSNKNNADFLMLDSNIPLISPINYHPQMFPVSTKNHFNINMDTQNYMQNYLEKSNNINNYITNFRFLNYQNYLENQNQNQTHLKEINMQDKILINEIDNENEQNNNEENEDNEENGTIHKENIQNTPKFPQKDTNIINEIHLLENNPTNSIDIFCNKDANMKYKNSSASGKKMNLDLDIVNQSESDTMQIFSDKVKSCRNNYHKFSFGEENNKNSNENEAENNQNNNEAENKKNKISPFSNLNLQTEKEKNENYKDNNNFICKTPQENIKICFQKNLDPNFFENNKNCSLNNTADKKILIKTPNTADGKNQNFLEPVNNSMKKEFLNKLNFIPIISPSRASLNISPKSAFVINKKLFNN